MASLYREMAKLGFSPSEVDGMEVWQAASLLGADLPDGAAAAGAMSDREIIAARVAAERGEAPSLEPEPTPLVLGGWLTPMGE
jgi:hypothetical protein